MEFFDVVTSSLWVVLSSVVPFLVVLTVIVFIHEYGHFKVARWCGVGVETFAVGFGREIIGKTDKYGTRWKLGWIPIGGYVKFEDDANAASMPAGDAEPVPEVPPSETAFHSKPLPSRAAVVAAGPAANFILAIIIYTLSFMFNGERVSLPVADVIMKGSAAEMAGMMAGDRIAELDGTEIDKFSDIQSIMARNHGSTIAVVVDRNGERLELSATPQVTQQDHILGGTYDVY
ncbi:MAG: PDZ domain-containing protein [Rhizobiales bacterium]|nr:PDZ domain-containing protein [Hyphomicrobiales bacterium]